MVKFSVLPKKNYLASKIHDAGHEKSFWKNCFILNFSDLEENCIVCEDLPTSIVDLTVTNWAYWLLMLLIM
jgi:hypothetical protein